MLFDYDTFEEFRDPESYDLTCDAVVEEVPLIAGWARSVSGPLLDLACGSGRTAIPLATRGFAVTGVDVMPEMLARGREKATARGVSVAWVEADACAFQLGGRFGLAYMVGNAFQMFWTRDQQEALLARVREHLAPGGLFIFETRNPSPRNLAERWSDDPQARTYTAPDGTRLVVTYEPSRYDPLTQIQHHLAQYHWYFSDGREAAQPKRIALRYVYPQEIETLLHYNGFEVRARYGSWREEPLTAASTEMIFVCQPHA